MFARRLRNALMMAVAVTPLAGWSLWGNDVPKTEEQPQAVPDGRDVVLFLMYHVERSNAEDKNKIDELHITVAQLSACTYDISFTAPSGQETNKMPIAKWGLDFTHATSLQVLSGPNNSYKIDIEGAHVLLQINNGTKIEKRGPGGWPDIIWKDEKAPRLEKAFSYFKTNICKGAPY